MIGRILFLLAFLPLPTQAAEPLAALRAFCPRIAELQVHAASECPALTEREADARATCQAMHVAYAKSTKEARALAKKARAWIKKNGVVRDNHTSVTVLMNLSADPGYPLQNTNIDRITNDAIAVGYESLETLQEKTDGLDCAGPAYEAWWQALTGDGESLNRLHTANAMAVGDFLLKEKNEIEREAQGKTSKELRRGGVTVRPVR